MSNEDYICTLREGIQGGARDFLTASYIEDSGTMETRWEHVHALIRQLQEEEGEARVEAAGQSSELGIDDA